MFVNNKHWGVVLFVHNLNNCVKYPNKKNIKNRFHQHPYISSCMCVCVSACAGGRRRVGWGIQVKTNSWRFQMTPPPLLGRSTTQQYNNRLRVLYQMFHSEAVNAMVLRPIDSLFVCPILCRRALYVVALFFTLARPYYSPAWIQLLSGIRECETWNHFQEAKANNATELIMDGWSHFISQLLIPTSG